MLQASNNQTTPRVKFLTLEDGNITIEKIMQLVELNNDQVSEKVLRKLSGVDFSSVREILSTFENNYTYGMVYINKYGNRQSVELFQPGVKQSRKSSKGFDENFRKFIAGLKLSTHVDTNTLKEMTGVGYNTIYAWVNSYREEYERSRYEFAKSIDYDRLLKIIGSNESLSDEHKKMLFRYCGNNNRSVMVNWVTGNSFYSHGYLVNTTYAEPKEEKSIGCVNDVIDMDSNARIKDQESHDYEQHIKDNLDSTEMPEVSNVVTQFDRPQLVESQVYVQPHTPNISSEELNSKLDNMLTKCDVIGEELNSKLDSMLTRFDSFAEELNSMIDKIKNQNELDIRDSADKYNRTQTYTDVMNNTNRVLQENLKTQSELLKQTLDIIELLNKDRCK